VQCTGIKDIASIPITSRCKPQDLKGLCALFLGFKIEKQTSMSNWEANDLSAKQVTYAATDAWCSLEVYLKMIKMPYDPNS